VVVKGVVLGAKLQGGGQRTKGRRTGIRELEIGCLGYQVNRKSGCSTVRCPVEIQGIRISGQWFEKSHHI
jgi:hypothetical protein